MKRFKFLGALFVGLIGLVSFGYCGFLFTTKGTSNSENLVANGGTTQVSGYTCFNFNNTNCYTNLKIYDLNGTLLGSNFYTTSQSNSYYCINGGTYIIENNRSSDCTMYKRTYTDYSLCSCPTCEEQYTSEECQQEYSLMPINSCNSEYCGLNGLCPEYTGSTMSELYINGINHLGAPIINISFPLEQAWDYEYTGDTMNINLSGENNVDYEYMDNIIRTQNSKPNDTDFNNIISGLIPKFVPGLVIILFILFVFRFLKKIF